MGIRRGIAYGLAAAAVTVLSASAGEETSSRRVEADHPGASPLRIVVMDPLSAQLACDCVAGYAQRDYGRLAQFLEKRLARPVQLAYAESLFAPPVRAAGAPEVVIGKFSEVLSDAAGVKLPVRTLAMLSGKDGQITQTGMFVVRQRDSARSIADLRDHRLLFGPQDAMEKHAAAVAALEAFGLPKPQNTPASPSCSTAALAVVEEEADAAVISSYAMPLLEGCGTIDKGSLRIVGRTDAVPFIGVFVTDRVDSTTEKRLGEALDEAAEDSELLIALESKDGFVRLPPIAEPDGPPGLTWNDWRGPKRDGITGHMPQRLPTRKRLLWSRVLTGPGMSGVAVDSGRVVVADKSIDQQHDIFRCLDADTGQQVWKLQYPAPGDMDFTNSPRATPVIRQGLVYLLGAFGHLHCVRLADGVVVWRRNLAVDFDSKVPTWGYCSSPLVVDGKLIVNPGAKDASLAALDRLTGEVLWTTPGDPPAYAGFVLAEPGGVRQVVGYDAVSLGGWDPDTGRRLWRLVPEFDGDFNVPTPVVVGQLLLVSSENNGTRLYGFDRLGRIRPEPLAATEDLAPDTSTPIVHGGKVFGNFGGLVCLDLNDGLRTVWQSDDDPFVDYCSLIAGEGRVLVTSQTGTLSLLDAASRQVSCLSTLDLFSDVADTERDVWSHPALVAGRLYIRNLLAAYCFILE